MRSRKPTRLTAMALLAAGVAAGGVATAAPAHAVQVQQCTGGYTFVEQYGITQAASGQPAVYAYAYDQCNNALFSIDLPVSISQYVGNVGWETVARGMGYTQFTCTSVSLLYTTSVTSSEGKAGFYCG